MNNRFCSTQFFTLFIVLFFLQTAALAQFFYRNFEFEGNTREYTVFLPQNFQSNTPVVFILHGYLQSASDIIGYTRMSDVADTAGFIAIYPDAIWPGWNTGLIHEGMPPLDTLVNDVGFVSAIIDTLVSHYDIDVTRVYCCGFSLGGQMSFKLACELGHRFAVVASVAGPVNEIFAPGAELIKPIPALYIHGTADKIVLYPGDPKTNHWSVEETANFWIGQNDCVLPADTVSLPNLNKNDGSRVEKISYSNNAIKNSFLFYKVIGGGHSWPGSPLDKDWGKPRNLDIHASSLIWNFFKDHVTSIKMITNTIPGEFYLSQNYPNPFNPSTTIKYDLSKPEFVTITVLNTLGQKIETLVNKRMPMGHHQIAFRGTHLPSGVYFYMIEAGEYVLTRKMLLVK